MRCKQNASPSSDWLIKYSTWHVTEKLDLLLPSPYFLVFAFFLPIFANAFLSSSCRYKPIEHAKLRSGCMTHGNNMDTNLQQNCIYLVEYCDFSLLLFSNKHPLQGQVILYCVWLRTMWGRYSLLLQKGQFRSGQVKKKKRTTYEELNYKAHRHLLLSLLLANFNTVQGQVANKSHCCCWFWNFE
jgi:hypothetical protein